jgi:hypothetical protein
VVALMMEAASISETSVNVYETARHDNLEDSCFRSCRRQQLGSHNDVAIMNRVG